MDVNWIAVLLGAVFNMVVGTLWYGPLFGKLWLGLMEKTREEIQGGNGLMYLIPFVLALISALVLNILISSLGVTIWWSGLAWGALLWFAFGATGLLTTGFFEDKKQSLSWLFIGYQVLVHAVEGAVFAIW